MRLLCVVCFALAPTVALAADRDRFGDPLPAGAVARLGTVRWRIATRNPDTAPRFSPDGKSIAVLDGQSVRLWEVSTGKTLWRATTIGTPTELCFSPDGTTLAVGDEWRVRLLNATTGRLKLELEHRSAGARVRALAYSSNGRWLAVADKSELITIWDTTTADRVFEKMLIGVEVQQLSVAGDDKHLLILGRNHPITYSRLIIYDWVKQAILSDARPTDSKSGWGGVSRDGKLMTAFSSEADDIGLVDPMTLRTIRTVAFDRRPRFGLTISPDGRRLAVVVERPNESRIGIQIADTATGKPSKNLQFPDSDVHRVICSEDMRTVATLGKGNVVRLWNIETGRQTNALTSHDREITALTFTPDGTTIVTGSGTGTIRVWDSANGEHRRELPGHRDGVNAVAVTADGSTIVSCGTDAIVPLRDLATGKELRRFDLKLPPEGPDPSTPHQVISVALSADGARLSAYSLSDGTERAAYHAWELATGKSLTRRGFPRSPGYLALAADGRSAVEYISPSNARGEAARTIPLALRDLGTGGIRRLFLPPEEFELHTALSPDGLTLATETSRRLPLGKDEFDVRSTIRLWDVPTGEEYLAIAGPDGTADSIVKLAFSADGRRLATAHSNRSVMVWDARTGDKVLALTRLDAEVKCLAFSPDGRRLATGHADSTALVWDVPADVPVADSPPDLRQLWADLGDTDARRARAAMARLAAAPKETTAFFAERLMPASPFPGDKISGWLKDLSHERFATRQAATRALGELGERVQPHLLDYLATDPPQEGRYRAKRLLSAISPLPPPGELVRLRAVPVLAWIGTPDARAILTRLAAGDPASHSTTAAQAALRAK